MMGKGRLSESKNRQTVGTYCIANTKEVGIDNVLQSKYITFSSTPIFQFRFLSTIPVTKQRIVWHVRKRRRTPKPNILFR